MNHVGHGFTVILWKGVREEVFKNPTSNNNSKQPSMCRAVPCKAVQENYYFLSHKFRCLRLQEDNHAVLQMSAANTHIFFLYSHTSCSIMLSMVKNKQTKSTPQKKKKCRVSFPISPVESCQRLAGAGDCALGFKGLFLNVGLFENLITSHLDVWSVIHSTVCWRLVSSCLHTEDAV